MPDNMLIFRRAGSKTVTGSRRALLLLPLLGLFACGPAPEPPVTKTPPAAATIVFMHGGVWTADPERPLAQAVAVDGEHIVYVGDDAGAEGYVGAETRVFDLAGRMLLPGFHDAHAHVLAGGATLTRCDLLDTRDPSRLRGLLEECASMRDYGPDEWVLGNRWPLASFEGGMPPKAWLDQIFEGRPAYFLDSFGHNGWVSSRALEIAGIDTMTPDPPQGRIERDPDGRPNGTLRDAAIELVTRHIPDPTDAELDEHLARGLAEVSRFGITAFVEPGLNLREAMTYQRADHAGRLSARVLGSLSPESEAAARFGEEIWPLLAQRQEPESERFRTHSVKVYIDGVIEAETSFMLQPYHSGSNFPPFYPPGELNALYSRLDALGLQIHTHAIGDGAIREALDAYAHARAANGPNDNRHQIVHLQLIDAGDIPRFAELGVAANFQGLWAYPDDYIDMAIPLVGEDRVEQFYRLASVQRAGGLLVGGSDWDVSSLNPLDAIETVVRRQDPWSDTGPELGEGERIDLPTALAMYTRNAAWVMRLEGESGMLKPGLRADLVVLNRDLFEIPPQQINESQVLLTLVDGEVVYEP
jgi:predicted amidohydrolase YtcJ